jgi:hypothetical protein
MNWSRKINKDTNMKMNIYMIKLFFVIFIQSFLTCKNTFMNALLLIWGDVWRISLYYNENNNYALIINVR